MPYFLQTENAPQIIVETPPYQDFGGGLNTRVLLVLPAGQEIELGMARDIDVRLPMDEAATVTLELLLAGVREKPVQ